MRRYGLPVSYGGDEHPEPLVLFDGERVGYECKRVGVGKPSSIRKNLREAACQLENRIKDDICDSGIIHINISKLINPLGMVLVGADAKELHRSQARHDALRFFRYFAFPFQFNKYPNIQAVTVNYAHLSKDEQYSENDTYVHHMMAQECVAGSPFIQSVRSLIRKNATTKLSGYETSSGSFHVSD